MGSATLVDRYLDVAEELLETRPRSAAYRRRAVSSAYYAVFHALAKLCVEALLADAARTSLKYQRVYRALDHGPVKTMFAQSPLKENADLGRLGNVIVRLQSARHAADYLPPDKNLFPLQDARDLVEQARQVATDIAGLDREKRRLLATSLLFKGRQG